MEIRGIKKEEKNLSKQIWIESFKDEREYVEWYYKEIFKLENNIGVFHSSKMIGMLFSNPYRIKYERDIILGNYLLAISIVPEHRGEGIFRKLLEERIRDEKKRGNKILFLTPIDSSIYEKFGFSYMSNLEIYHGKIKDLVGFKKDREIIRVIGEKEIDFLSEFYNKYIEKFKMAVHRNREEMRNIVEETKIDGGESYILKDPAGKITGYFAIIPENNELYIKEIIFTDRETVETIFTFIYSFGNYYENIKICSPENANINFYLSNKKVLKREVFPKMQMRILDIEYFAKKISEKIANEDEINVKIIDREILENNKIYKITSNKIEEIEAESDIEITIEEFGYIVSGYFNLDEILQLKKIKILNVHKLCTLKNIINKGTSYINQWF